MTKVLVFTPVAGLDAEAVQSAFCQTWAGPRGILFYEGSPSGNARTDILRSYEYGRAAALEGGYDAMLTLESDMVLPNDILAKLAELDEPVVHALYAFREPGHTWNALVGTAWPGKYVEQPDLKRLLYGRVVQVLGVGFGCTLIRRDVLEAVPFRLGPDAHCDWYFAEDCAAAGIRVLLHGGAVCGHKGRDGVIWWPEAGGGVTASKSAGGEVYAYTGLGAYIPGLPALDFSPEAWAQQPEHLRTLAERLGVNRHIIPGPESWTLDGRFQPCQR